MFVSRYIGHKNVCNSKSKYLYKKKLIQKNSKETHYTLAPHLSLVTLAL